MPTTRSSREPKVRSPWLRWGLLVLLLAAAIGMGCTLALPLINTSPKSGSLLPSKTIDVIIPPNTTGSAGQSRTVSVTIPDSVLEKLGPSHDTGAKDVFQIVWPGLSTLLGALVGGGVTFGAGFLKNSQEQRASNESRKRFIEDRSFNACVDVLKSGRLFTAAVTKLWYAIYTREPRDRIIGNAKALEKATRDWYAASEVVRLTVPPEAKHAFDDYNKALGVYHNKVQEWKIEYLASPSPSAESDPDITFDDASYAEYDRLEDDLLAKRDAFTKIVKSRFEHGAWSDT